MATGRVLGRTPAHASTWCFSVDLLGRLSNPRDTVETLTGQGVERFREPHAELPKPACVLPHRLRIHVQEVPGRLSNPAPATDTPPRQSPLQVQRRLSACDVDDICGSYVRGSSIDELARSFGVNRTTIIKHLDQRSVPRRRVVRKMTDVLVAEAAAMYLHGDSLWTVADAFKIDTRTQVESSARLASNQA